MVTRIAATIGAVCALGLLGCGQMRENPPTADQVAEETTRLRMTTPDYRSNYYRCRDERGVFGMRVFELEGVLGSVDVCVPFERLRVLSFADDFYRGKWIEAGEPRYFRFQAYDRRAGFEFEIEIRFFEQTQLPAILALAPEPADALLANHLARMVYREVGSGLVATNMRGELRLFEVNERFVRGTFNDVEVMFPDGNRRVLRDGFFEFGP